MVSLLTKHRNKRAKVWCNWQSCGWLHTDARNGYDRPRLLSAHIKRKHITAAGRTDAEKAGAINRNLIIAIESNQLRSLPQAVKKPRVNGNAAETAVAKTEKVEIVRWKLNAGSLDQR